MYPTLKDFKNYCPLLPSAARFAGTLCHSGKTARRREQDAWCRQDEEVETIVRVVPRRTTIDIAIVQLNCYAKSVDENRENGELWIEEIRSPA